MDRRIFDLVDCHVSLIILGKLATEANMEKMFFRVLPYVAINWPRRQLHWLIRLH